MTSLNPAYTIGNQLEEALLRHRRVGRRQARERALYLLDRVGIPSAAGRLKQYPHQLSGGLRQRVMIAMALMCGPVADPGRRADHGARRDDPGADPAPAGRAAARVRHGAGADHARPRHRRAHRHAGGGDVCGPGRGDGHGAGDLLGAGAPLYARAARLHSGARQDAARREARHHPRHGAVADRRDARLPLRRALPVCRCGVPGERGAAGAGRGARPSGALHPPRRDRRAGGPARARGGAHESAAAASKVDDTAPIVEARGVVRTFSVSRGAAQGQAHAARGRRRRPVDPARRGGGAGRRIRAAARPRWRACCSACWRRPRARSASAARPARRNRGARSRRWCSRYSRTPIRRSIRASRSARSSLCPCAPSATRSRQRGGRGSRR